MKPIQPPQTPQSPQKPPQKFGPVTDIEDTFGGVLDGASKICLWGGLLAMIVGVAFLMTTYQVFASGGTAASLKATMAAAGQDIGNFAKEESLLSRPLRLISLTSS